jgi:hypothetical protein
MKKFDHCRCVLWSVETFLTGTGLKCICSVGCAYVSVVYVYMCVFYHVSVFMREVPHDLRISLVCVCGENERGREREGGKKKTCREELTKECARFLAQRVIHDESAEYYDISRDMS